MLTGYRRDRPGFAVMPRGRVRGQGGEGMRDVEWGRQSEEEETT